MASGKEKTAPPRRPTIALPPRNPFGYFGSTSPGPMTLVSSFFADDPDNDCPSFRQLLAGAMASPRPAEAGDGRLGVRQSTPVGMLVVPSPVFTVPAGISPAGLLESPVLFSPGRFGMSHQQALAQVTAQAAWSNSYKNVEAEFANVSTTKETSVKHPEVSRGDTGEQVPGKTSDNASLKLELAAGLQVEHKSQPAPLNVEKPADDGYNWRKYGQKQVKGSAYPRSYYRCTYPKCSVTKKVERSVGGQVTGIIYKGEHNHERPPVRRVKEGGMLSQESNGRPDLTRSLDGQPGNPVKLNGIRMKEHESDQVTTGHLSVESYGEDVGDAEVGMENREDDEPDLKKRNMDNGVVNSVASHKTVAEQKVILQTRSEVNLLDDGYRWRKYGQKVVKGNHHPRSYYRCTYAGCNVRKHVERASADPGAVITTYEGKHNHDVPAARNSSHNTASVDSFVNATQNAASNTT